MKIVCANVSKFYKLEILQYILLEKFNQNMISSFDNNFDSICIFYCWFISIYIQVHL